MLNRYILAFLALFLVGSSSVSAQFFPSLETDVQLNEKYYLLRNIFKERFVRIGSCDRGYSIPMSRIEFDFTGPDGDKPPGTKVGWGDGGIMIGQYLNALATEYNQLHLNRQPLDSTLDEIYYALNAIYRMDASSGDYFYLPFPAEAHAVPPVGLGQFINPVPACNYYTGPSPYPCINDANYASVCDGFIIRDDVYAGFKDLFGAEYMASEREPQYSGNCNNIEMSGDQAFGYIQGLYMIAKYCDGAYHNGLHFAEFARFEIQKVYDAIKWDNGPPPGSPVSHMGWQLENPHNGYELSSEPSGYNIYVYATPLNRIVSDPVVAGISFPPDAPAIIASDAAFAFTSTNPYWYRPVADWFILGYSSLGTMWDKNTIANWALPKRKEYFYLLAQMTHPGFYLPAIPVPGDATGAMVMDELYFTAMLNDCPCHGKFNTNHPDSTSHHYGWNVRDRNVTNYCEGCNPFLGLAVIFGLLEDNFEKGKLGEQNMEFPPIDYFNLFNAHKIVHGSPDDYYNLWDTYVWRVHPYISPSFLTSGVQGSISSPRRYRSLKQITSDALFGGSPGSSSSAKATFIAKDEITLLPGFEVRAGAEFDAFIEEQPIKCISGDIFRLAPDSTAYSGEGLPDYMRSLEVALAGFPASDPSGLGEMNAMMEMTAPKGFNPGLQVSSFSAALSPNPTTGEVFLEIVSPTETGLSLRLFDSRMNLVREYASFTVGEGMAKVPLQLQPLSSGLYFLQVTGAGTQHNLRFMMTNN